MHDIASLKSFLEDHLRKSVARPRQTANGFFSARLTEAITYALMPPAKRLRPMLTLATALAHRSHMSEARALRLALPSAIAVEYIHTYSLIHDDLPAMDDDDYRRGRLSVHRRFDEAIAILAGDALLADSFAYASSSTFNAGQICQELALMAGRSGLVAGQAEDLNVENKSESADRWLQINAAKTSRLFEASCVAGALAVDAPRVEIERARQFGRNFGHAFQIKDDIDDKSGIAERESSSTLAASLREQVSALGSIEHHTLRTIIQGAFATAV